MGDVRQATSLFLCISALLVLGCSGEFRTPSEGVPNGEGGGGMTSSMDATTTGNVQDAGQTDTSSDVVEGDVLSSDGGRPDFGGEVTEETLDVFERLRPTCEGCHLNGSSFPAFADLNTFVNLIVSDPLFVVPGDPDASELVRLLEANGTRQWRQMPNGSQSFQDLELAGQTAITTAEVRDWIEALEGVGPVDLEEPVLVRRLTTEQILASLYDQLGLEPSDFLQTNPNTGDISNVRRERYPIHGVDMVPRVHPNAGSHAQERFEALGGPSFLNGVPRVQDLAPLFGHTFTQTVQAWCRVSVNKADNDALFPMATRSDTSSSNPDAIKANMRFLFLKMLAVEASNEEVDDLFDTVFVPYESESGTSTAWIAVCASMIRDPLWLTY